MRLKHFFLALSLLMSTVLGVSAPGSVVQAGAFNWTRLMSAGDCGPGAAFSPNQPNPSWNMRLAAASDNRVFVTSTPARGICVINAPDQVSLYAGAIDPIVTPPEEASDVEPALGAVMMPVGVAVDSSGNVIFSDAMSNRIRKIDSDGFVTSIAGSLAYDNIPSGIGGPATLAQLGTTLQGVAVAPDGQVFFVEAEGPRILRVDGNGLLQHVAGKWACLGLGGDGGLAVNAELAWPNDVAVTSTGIVYISDSANGRIRKIDSSGIITTLYGDGNLGPEGCQGFERPGGGAETLSPLGIALDSNNNLIIADLQGRLVVIAPNNDRCYIEVPQPTDVTVDSNDRIIFATEDGGVWRIEDYKSECEPDSPVITTWAETKSPTSYRMAAFSLGFSTEVTGLTADDFSIAGSAPGCTINLDTSSEEYFRKRTVLVACQGTGKVRLTLKKGAVATPNRGSGPPAAMEGPEVELVNGAVVRVSKAVYRLGEQGTVTSSVGGVNCGDSCSATVSSGTRLILTATPGQRNVFLGWSGACSGTGPCTITVRGDIDVQARFFPGELLAVTRFGAGGGTVTSSRGGISCGNQCSTFVYVEDPVTLTARADARSIFLGWFGAGCTGTGTCTIQGGGSVFAVFNKR